MRLHDIAHARAGDKGDTSTITVIPYDDADYAWLARWLTADRVHDHFADLVNGGVTRFELPLLPALQFVCRNSLDGGVTTSVAIDTHGKGMSFRLLALHIPRLVVSEESSGG
ncbi:hypothetical protein [Kribbella sp. NPDC051620]|uniref:AtuA-related protein n=1 Tax=Kribbella sp. NPDC051620 TaxID=3364120 RepID=UPI0037AA9248